MSETAVLPQEGWAMVGQEHAVDALLRALDGDLLAHAYLFSGPPGVGKGTLALRLAQTLLCNADKRPCLQCRACRQIEAGEAPDIEHIAIGGVCDESSHRDHSTDGSTRIRICQIRRLERVASLAPFQAPRRIFIVDTADDLQIEAAHALLKTLEEPPATVLLILLATDVEALLPTIRSRCQRLTLRPAPAAELAAALQDRSGVPADEAAELARLARGRYGLAMRMHADPSLRVLQETVTADVRRLSGAGRNERFDYAEQLSRSWYGERDSVLATLDIWRAWWRDVLLAAAHVDAGPLDDDVREEAARCSPEQALQALRAAQRAREHLTQNTNAQLALEVMMLDLPVLPELEREEAREVAASPS